MKHIVRLLVFIPLLLAFQCDDDSAATEEPLLDTGLLGKWEIADETINGLSDLLPKCCIFIELEPDKNVLDFSGIYTATYSDSEVYTGSFELKQNENQIIFRRQDQEDLFYTFSLNEAKNYLSLSFSENGANIKQGWNKQTP